MKLWFSAPELAEFGLNGLPKTTRGLSKFASRNNWAENIAYSRKRAGREGGGGLEYHLDILPMIARLDYLARQVVIDVVDIAQGREATDETPISSIEMIERDARLAIVAIAGRFKRDTGYTTLGADDWFCRMVRSGSFELPQWITNAVSNISTRSISRWRALAKSGNAGDLAFNRANSRAGTGVLDRAENGAIKKFILAHLANNPHLTAKHVRLVTADRFGQQVSVQGRPVSLPPLRTFQNTLRVWKQTYRNELMRLSDPDTYKSKVRFVATGTTYADRLNQIWEIDASPLDMMTTDGRVNIYVATDIYSRRCIIHMTHTPRAVGVGELIRKCILAWGVPENIHTDNGSDFKANTTQRLLAALGIDVHYCDAYSPEQKGVVERNIKTFQHDFATIHPGFIGHNVADRKRIEGQRSFANRLGMDDDKIFNVSLSMADVQTHADNWASATYGDARHSSLGTSPNQKAALAETPARQLKHPEALDILLAPLVGSDGIRKVTKQGIRANNAHYLIGSVMPGQSVFCRFDPADAGRLYVFEPDGETFLGYATNWQLAGIDPAELVHRVRAEQKRIEDESILDIRAARRNIKPMDIADAMRREAIDSQPNLIRFPGSVESHETPMTAAAISAVDAPLAPPIPAKNPPKVVKLAARETNWDRYRRAERLKARKADSQILTEADDRWFAGYVTGPEYLSLQQMAEDFGEQALSSVE